MFTAHGRTVTEGLSLSGLAKSALKDSSPVLKGYHAGPMFVPIFSRLSVFHDPSPISTPSAAQAEVLTHRDRIPFIDVTLAFLEHCDWSHMAVAPKLGENVFRSHWRNFSLFCSYCAV